MTLAVAHLLARPLRDERLASLTERDRTISTSPIHDRLRRRSALPSPWLLRFRFSRRRSGPGGGRAARETRLHRGAHWPGKALPAASAGVTASTNDLSARFLPRLDRATGRTPGVRRVKSRASCKRAAWLIMRRCSCVGWFCVRRSPAAGRVRARRGAAAVGGRRFGFQVVDRDPAPALGGADHGGEHEFHR